MIELHGAEQLPVRPPGAAVATKLLMTLPPLLAGAVNVMVALALPAVAVPIVGAPGTLAGVTVFEIAEEMPLPIALLAFTVQVSAVPLASPVTVMGELLPLLLCAPQFAVYPVMADPPLAAGGVKLMVTCAFPAMATPIMGGPGTVAGTFGTTLFDAADEALTPAALVAVTVNT